jgi:hypothetical protein
LRRYCMAQIFEIRDDAAESWGDAEADWLKDNFLSEWDSCGGSDETEDGDLPAAVMYRVTAKKLGKIKAGSPLDRKMIRHLQGKLAAAVTLGVDWVDLLVFW